MSLDLQLSSTPASETTAECLVVGVVQSALGKQRALAAIDAAMGGKLLAHAEHSEFTGAVDQCVDVPTLGTLAARRVVLLGVGGRRDVTAASLRAFGARAARVSKAASLALVLPEKVSGADLRAVGEGVCLGAYRFTKYFTGERLPKKVLASATIHKADGKPTAAERKALDVGAGVAAAVCIARDAVNEPPNEFTPEVMATLARGIARKGGMKIKVLDKVGIAKAGMKLHYAVGQGSTNEPRFIHMTYQPKKAKTKIVFVGKGLTFDSGGLCIKPAAGMGEMKSDMGGAASVLGLMAAVALVKPNVEVHGVIGAAENMPDGSAYRPGDVFGSLDGKTVEIINTDAEGRLVLADALAYARGLAPDLIVDVATLTGACVVALGKLYSAYYSGSEKLARAFGASAKTAGENFWRMPLVEEMRDQLKSDIADLKHTGERWGGSITAALFLREFVGDVPWIHCDVAAPVLADRARGFYPKGGTGHPVLTFLDFVESQG